MATYAYLNILLMERTATAVAPNAALTQIVIPVITVSGVDIRPRGFAIAAASGDFEFATGITGDIGDSYDVVSTSLAASTQIVRSLGAEEELWLHGTGADEDITIRWFWANSAVDGVDLAAPHGVAIPTRTFEQNAPVLETELVPPDGAVELVIEEVSGNSMDYRVDDGVANGEIITITPTDVTPQSPYRIYINTADRIRWARNGGLAVVRGFWRYSG